MRHTAIYMRVSSATQTMQSQEPDLRRWADAQSEPIKWYEDKATGGTMDRPGWKQLDDAMRTGQVSQVVVWRIDRLGRTASGLTTLFDDLRHRKVNLVSIKDGVDLSTPAGRMMANVLASVAQFEREVRGERQRAGIDAAKAKGKRWGGSRRGVRRRLTPTKERMIHQLRQQNEPVTEIAKAVGLSRQTVYGVLNQVGVTGST